MLSALLCVKNEQEHLQACLDSLHFVDEIVVIDDESTDATAEIAKKANAKYFRHKMNDDWSAQRNFGLEQCSGDWILVIDADERVSTELAAGIVSIVKNEKLNKRAYQLRRENYFEREEPLHGVLRTDWVKRLFPKEGARYEGLVHEKVITPYATEKVYVGSLSHLPYADWDEYFGKFNRYTKLAAKQKFEHDDRAKVYFVFDILIRPFFAFLKMYFLERGFLDGKVGFILSVNHYFYTMTKYVRLMALKEGRQ